MFSFGFSLSLKEKEKDRLELSLSLVSRLILAFFFVLSCLVLVSSILSNAGTASNTIPVILVVVTGLSALYDERWVFDRRGNRLENRFGLLVLCRKRGAPLDEMIRVDLDVFTKGQMFPTSSSVGLLKNPQRQRIVRLSVVDKQGNVYVLDTANAHRAEAFERTGRRLADFCGIPFESVSR